MLNVNSLLQFQVAFNRDLPFLSNELNIKVCFQHNGINNAKYVLGFFSDGFLKGESRF